MNKRLKIVTYLLSVALLSSCNSNQSTNTPHKGNESNICQYPFKANGMNYMLVRAVGWEGLTIVNLTKDSLEVAQLNK